MPAPDFLEGPRSELCELTATADRFLSANYSIAKRRETIASCAGYDRSTWDAFADLGWLSIPFAECDGGLGGGARELACLMSALGRASVLEPYLDAVVLAGTLLAECPSGALRNELIAKTVSGRGFATVALIQQRRRDHEGPIATEARTLPEGVALYGQLALVPFAQQSSMMLVPARQPDWPSDEFAIYAVAPGEVNLRSLSMIDGTLAADLTLEGTCLPTSRMVVGPPTARVALARAVRTATYCVCVEAVSIMRSLIEETAEHLRVRNQFGQALAKFQALQHTIADMGIAFAQADGAAWMAGHLLDLDDAALRDRVLAAAKYEAGRAGRYVGQRAVQLHGAIGMTDEVVVGHRLKRLIGIDLLYGGWLHQLDKFRLSLPHGFYG
jgi:alkylation response protein AidB-like acyl-CoA dehydrogenase